MHDRVGPQYSKALNEMSYWPASGNVTGALSQKFAHENGRRPIIRRMFPTLRDEVEVDQPRSSQDPSSPILMAMLMDLNGRQLSGKAQRASERRLSRQTRPILELSRRGERD